MCTRIFILSIFLFLVSSSQVFAVQMESPNYRLELENVQNNEPRSGVNPTFEEANPTIPENLFNTFQTQGYVNLTDEDTTNKEVTFNLSKTDISFDTSEINSTDNAMITVSGTVPFGYKVYIIKKNDILNATTGEKLPQTYCNNQSNPCTRGIAKAWTQEASYGIGYNAQGKDISSDFKNGSYFRPFPDAGEVTLMNNLYISEAHDSQLTIKLNTNPTQSEGTYEGMYEIRFVPET